tara:strand:+ start:15418 stop:17154 length:1737 start_codon:yes stop_codon:yes gene_type:complete
MKPKSMDHYLAKELSLGLIDSPEYMTYIGIFDFLNPIIKHNSKLSVNTLEDSYDDYLDRKEYLEMVKSYANDELTEIQKITQKIAIFDSENDIKSFEKFRYHSYPITQIGGSHQFMIDFMTDVHPIRNEREARDYIKRISLFDQIMENQIIWLKEQAKQGIYAPTFVYEHVIRQLQDIINTDSNPLITEFTKKIDDLDISDDKKMFLSNQLTDVINNEFESAYSDLLAYMIENKDNANKNHGVWSLPNGDEYYALRLRIYTTTDYSAQEIHDIGKNEVERVSARMKVILNDLGYDPNRPVGLLMNDLNEDPQFLYADTADRKEIVVADYNAMVKEATEGIKEYFNRMPKARVEVRAVPEHSEENQAGGYYRPPSLDGKRPGVFYANLYDIKQTPTYSMKALTFHEANPGHHLQNALNQENEDLTLYRKLGYGTSAFGEGWALYSERLATEAGLTENPLDELGVLQSELFRAVRLVVDTGIHYKRWTREEAMDYMKKMTGMSDTEVRAEIERYIVWPGQACSYKMGMIKILELREKAKTELGDDFDIRDFHDIILNNGSPPLFILESIVDDWVIKTKST